MKDITEAKLTEYEINDEFLHHILLELPEGTRAVFNLFAIDGYSHKEIGEMLGISEEASRWHLHKARQILKEKLLIFFDWYENFGVSCLKLHKKIKMLIYVKGI